VADIQPLEPKKLRESADDMSGYCFYGPATTLIQQWFGIHVESGLDKLEEEMPNLRGDVKTFVKAYEDNAKHADMVRSALPLSPPNLTCSLSSAHRSASSTATVSART
jgi:hypothetical protein